MSKTYTLDEIEVMYRVEHPEWDEATIRAKAKEIHRSLNTMDTQWRRNCRRFRRHVVLCGAPYDVYPDPSDDYEKEQAYVETAGDDRM